MEGADPRKVGLSKNCLEAIEGYTQAEIGLSDEFHKCLVHKDEKACEYAKDTGKWTTQQEKDKMWKWCFFSPRDFRTEGK